MVFLFRLRIVDKQVALRQLTLLLLLVSIPFFRIAIMIDMQQRISLQNNLIAILDLTFPGINLSFFLQKAEL